MFSFSHEDPAAIATGCTRCRSEKTALGWFTLNHSSLSSLVRRQPVHWLGSELTPLESSVPTGWSYKIPSCRPQVLIQRGIKNFLKHRSDYIDLYQAFYPGCCLWQQLVPMLRNAEKKVVFPLILAVQSLKIVSAGEDLGRMDHNVY